jgi:hypothetical protein
LNRPDSSDSPDNAQHKAKTFNLVSAIFVVASIQGRGYETGQKRAMCLLQSQRSGRHNFYALDLHGLTVLRTYLDAFWEDVLEAFQAAAIRESRPARKP